jgi:hypothetical protein
LHGLPGHEKNLDLAHDLRLRGVHTLTFSFRGAWGSEGEYSMNHLVPDTLVAFRWLSEHPDVDRQRVALIGASLGGWAALTAAAAEPRVRCVAALAPLLDPAAAPLTPQLAEISAEVLRGTSPERLRTEWSSLRPIREMASELTDRPVFLATGDADDLFPPEHYERLPTLLRHLTWVRFPGADHLFSSVRPGLRHSVWRWLLDELSGDP